MNDNLAERLAAALGLAYEVGTLRAQARECREMLDALSAGLDAVVQGQDTAARRRHAAVPAMVQ